MVKIPDQQKLLPPLENGDRLNRYEFERRYNAMPHLMLVDENGVIRSRVFPGLWLVVDEWLAGNMIQVFAVLQAGLASLEQAAFVEQRSPQQ